MSSYLSPKEIQRILYKYVELNLMQKLLFDLHLFVDRFVLKLNKKYPTLLKKSMELDHVCYRCETKIEYQKIIKTLLRSGLVTFSSKE